MFFLFSETASFEADIAFFARRHDSDTRQWFFDDFDKWFHDPGDSRAYVLLGDPGVGKSVMAAVLAQRKRRAGHLGAAYFCRHNDGTRNDPRYLLGTVACQLCESNSQYNSIVGGEGGVRNLLGNSKLGFPELFTKLLQEPLGKCNPIQQRKLVIIDALDETQYESREDFLDLIMHRFPLLPKWLVFFITSRPEDSVQFRLKKYNPCVKICAGNCDQHNFYQQHEQDIQTFLTKRIDFFPLPYSVKDMSKKCHGLFLYAHYIVEELRLSVHSGKKLNQLSDLFPGDIDDFFLQNFTRIYRKVGQDLFKKLFGCAIVAPSPLPVSIISYIQKREKSNHDEQRVIDAVSQFVVLRTSDQTLTFLHNLIPAWLTDKKKASRKLFIDKKIAGEYLRTIFVEIIASVVNEPQPTCPSIDVDLEDYVSRVAVRFLCQYGERDSLKAVFSCLTSYHFIERRMLNGKIEIYRLLEDLKLAAGCLPFEEANKQEILQKILFDLETNVCFLLECPHLLHSCIRNSSNPVQEAVLIPQTSSPWLEWNVYAFPDAKIADMKCFATSPDQRTVAGAKGRSILFFDASTAETVNSPFQLLNDLIDDIYHLEFTPEGKFIFFGRLDKWFSVERGCVEDFPQFSGNSHNYKWGVFTRDGQSIVVKRDFLSNPATCEAKSCLFNLLALWALKEIEESQDGEMTVRFCPQVQCREPGVQIERLLKRLGILNRTRQTPTSFLGASLERDRETERERENTGNKSEHTVLHDPSCHYCCRLRDLTDSSQEPSLATLRQLVVEFYSFIFNYQVWDLQTGMPVLQQVFSHDVQLNPFTYLCHVSCATSECGLKMKCSGIEEAMSVCNIAAVTVVCYAFGVFLFGRAFELESKLKQKQEQEQMKATIRKRLGLCLQKVELQLELELERQPLRKLELELEWLREQELELQQDKLQKPEQERLQERRLEREQEREQELEREQERERERELERKQKREWLPEWELELELEQLREQELELDRELELERKWLREREMELERERERLQERERESLWEREWELERERERLRERELGREREWSQEWKLQWDRQRQQQQEWLWELELTRKRAWLRKWFWERERERECLRERERELERERERKLVLEWKRLVSTGWFREFHDETFKFGVYTNIPKGFQNLVYDVNGEICICVSPEIKWIMEAGDSLRLISLQTGNRDRHFIHHGKPEYIISKFTRFSFTNDDRYLVYSCEGSLHALSLQTGAVLTSVTGGNLYCFTRERQFGYLFRSETEETTIFLTNLFSPFKFISLSPMNKSVERNSIAAVFRTRDTVMSVSSYCVVTLWQASTLAFVCKWSLTVSGLQDLALHAKNCFLSSNGKLIAIHHGTKIILCSLGESKVEFLCSVLESECEFTVACFAFSADNTVLLFCVQDHDNRSELLFHLWDIQNKVVSASFKPPGILEADCCCLSSNKRIILCGEYQIEIWEYADHNCRFLTNLAVQKPYNSVKFSFCTVSLDNEFLVCCFADVILVYRLHASNINSSKRVLRGHLGRVEFCQFLKLNRYLISYGVDGMVFLWDLSEWKAVGFGRIAQGRESIVSMAVSPDEDVAVCFTSSGRVWGIKLCNLDSALSLKCLSAPVIGKLPTDKTSQQIPVDVTSATQILTSIDHDTTESLSSSDSEEGYYLEDLEESD